MLKALDTYLKNHLGWALAVADAGKIFYAAPFKLGTAAVGSLSAFLWLDGAPRSDIRGVKLVEK